MADSTKYRGEPMKPLSDYSIPDLIKISEYCISQLGNHQKSQDTFVSQQDPRKNKYVILAGKINTILEEKLFSYLDKTPPDESTA